MKRAAIFLAALLQAACSSASQPEGATMKLNIPAFVPGAPVPRDNTCDGADRSPALEWSDVPGGTRRSAASAWGADAHALAAMRRQATACAAARAGSAGWPAGRH